MPQPPVAHTEGKSGGIRIPRSVVIALDALAALSQHQPIGVGLLAREMDLPKSTMQRTLSALEACGFAYRSGSPPKWSLTLKVFQLGARAMQDMDVRKVASPILERLRDETRESALLSMRDGDQTLILERFDSPEPVRAHIEEGMTFPIHTTAGGKAFLAALDDEFVERLLSRPLEQLTGASITDAQQLREEIAQVRELGYAVNRGEARSEVFSIAAVIRDASGYPVAAAVLAAPNARVQHERLEELGQKIIRAAAEISAGLGWEEASSPQAASSPLM